MDADSMDDLSEGVNKLQEFSSVLSAVTRGLDKNVRRLEDQFGKANTQLKEMKVTVEENKDATQQLRDEQDAQLTSLQEAVKEATSLAFGGSSAAPSEFMLDEVMLTDTRTVSIIACEEKQRRQEEDPNAHNMSDNNHKTWSTLVNDASSLTQRQTGLSVNEALHNMNKTLRKPRVLSAEEQEKLNKKSHKEQKEAAAAAKAAAPFPFPELKEDSTLAHAMGAMVQRMYRLENAVAIQSSVNESLVRIIRDDTQVQAVYDTVIGNIVDVEQVQRELASDNAKLRSALGKLGDHVEAYEKSMSDLAKGGHLRIESRTRRGERNSEGLDVVGANIEWGLDAYTVEESDVMAKRLAVVENQLSANGAVGVAIRRLGNDVEDLQAGMIERKEAEELLRRTMEESSSASGILKKKITACKKIWVQTLDQIKFGCDKYAQKVVEAEEAAAAERAAAGEAPEEDEEDEEDDEDVDNDSQVSAAKKRKEPKMIQLMIKLHEEATSCVAGSFVIRENIEETLEVLCPRLDQLTLLIEEIVDLDKTIRFGPEPVVKAGKAKGEEKKMTDEAEEGEDTPVEIISLGDLMCSDREYRMASVLQEVVRASVPVIDEMVDKIGMRRRIEKIENSSVSQDVLDAIATSSKNTAKELKGKANKDDVMLALSKRVLKEEISRLKQVILAKLDLTQEEHHMLTAIVEEGDEMEGSIMGDSVGTQGLHGDKGDKGDKGDRGGRGNDGKSSYGGGGGMGGGASSAAVQDLSKRIELLLKHLQDLQEQCQTYIPRDEVQEAMKAVLYEIKVIKMNTVNVNKFKEVTDLKADKTEVNQLMGVLSGALSDMMGTNVSASAKLRCLLCDKPVSAVAKRGEKPDELRSPSPPRTRGGNQHAADATLDANSSSVVSASRPSTSQPRLASSSSTSRLPDAAQQGQQQRVQDMATKAGAAKARIQSEITVLKGSLDLPAIDQPGSSGSARMQARVRASGGGGSVMQ